MTDIRRTVQLTDGRTFEAEMTVGDFIAFERHFNIDAFSTESNRVEHWAFLTWASLHRQGKISEDWEAFVLLIDSFVDAEADAPKEQAPSLEESTVSSPS